MELKEQELLDLIATGETIVLKVFMDDCSFCTEYEPIFAAEAKSNTKLKFVSFNLPARSNGGSVFKRKYMTANGKERIAAPATFVFEKGEMKHRQYGMMSAEALKEFIASGKPAGGSANGGDKEKAKQELMGLFARKGEIVTFTEELPFINQRINELKQFLQQG